MKRIILSYVVFASMLFIGSCSKDNSSPSCPAHYTGTNCTQQITPSQIQITKIAITNFPATNANTGNDWNLSESSGHADIYPVVADSAGNTISLFRSVFIQNASNQNINTFTPTSPIILSNPLSLYQLALFNYESLSADDNMGYIAQYFYSSTSGFPPTITFTSTSGVVFVVSVQYVW